MGCFGVCESCKRGEISKGWQWQYHEIVFFDPAVLWMTHSHQVYSPMSGTVTEKNLAVEDGPALINQNAEDEGWLFK